MYHGFAGRYEFSEGNSNKFWECLQDLNGTYIVRWGRIGTLGQEMTGVGYSEAEKKARSKEGKGYHYVAGSKTSVQAMRRDELEARVPAVKTTTHASKTTKRHI